MDRINASWDNLFSDFAGCIIELGYMDKGTGKHQSNIVYSWYGISPTLSASLGVKQPGIFFVENE